MSSERKIGLWKLLAGWGAYWAVLAVATLAKPIALIAGFSDQPDNSASASAGFNNGTFSASITQHGQTVWSGSEPVLSLVLWVAGPPLLMWIAWLITRSRAEQREAARRAQPTDVWDNSVVDQSWNASGKHTQSAPRGASVPQLPEPGMPFPADLAAKQREELHIRKSDERRS